MNFWIDEGWRVLAILVVKCSGLDQPGRPKPAILPVGNQEGSLAEIGVGAGWVAAIGPLLLHFAWLRPLLPAHLSPVEDDLDALE
jgi:hypothetical protein